MHAGHVAFALQALEVAELDAVYLMPEREPRGKHSEHYGHRVAMVRKALRPYARLHVLETVERRFTVRRTLAHLRQHFPDATFVFMLGSDLASSAPLWPHFDELVRDNELCIGLRHGDDADAILNHLQTADAPAQIVHMIEVGKRGVSSTAIRTALAMGSTATGMLRSVYRYARQEWLYIRK